MQSKWDHLEYGTTEGKNKRPFRLKLRWQPLWDRLTFLTSKPYLQNWGRGSFEHQDRYTILKISLTEIHLVESLGILKASAEDDIPPGKVQSNQVL